MGCCLLQPPEGGGAALVVEIGESVIQNVGMDFSDGSTSSQIASRAER